VNFDYEFLNLGVEAIKKENEEQGGLVFPFLETVQIQPARLLVAKLIATSRPPHFACFAAVYVKDGKYKPNGNWFSLDPEELAQEGLARITFRRVKADVLFSLITDPIMGDIISFSLNVTPNTVALEELFENENALKITNKNLLVAG
jgi:hypothetical protein